MNSPAMHPAPITDLLHQARDGDREAFDDLFPHVYGELRQIAHQRLFRLPAGETLATTALVHEAYLKLIDQASADWQDRAHFFAVASRAMRFILIDHAREKMAQKRGGDAVHVPLDDARVADGTAAETRAADLLSLDGALDGLMQHDERLGQLVEYRFFGGLTYEEIAAVTGRSVPTAKRDWRRARAWLYQAMRDDYDA